MRFFKAVSFSILFLMVLADFARAESNASPVPEKKTLKKKKQKEKKGQPHREKEAEGTEALNRFEADTVIRSHYKLNGEPLQVDPD